MRYVVLVVLLLILPTGCQTVQGSNQSQVIKLISKNNPDVLTEPSASQIVEESQANTSAKPLIPPAYSPSPTRDKVQKGMLVLSIIRVASFPLMMF